MSEMCHTFYQRGCLRVFTPPPPPPPRLSFLFVFSCCCCCSSCCFVGIHVYTIYEDFWQGGGGLISLSAKTSPLEKFWIRVWFHKLVMSFICTHVEYSWNSVINTLLDAVRHFRSIVTEPLRMRTNVVYFRVMRRLYHRKWNWLCVNQHPWQRTRGHGVWRRTSIAHTC